MLKVIFLKDFDENSTDGVIIAEETTAEEIQEVIEKVKEEIELYSWEDIEEALPKDCKLYWANEDQAVYY